MKDKLKLIYNISPIILLVISCFACYFAYQCWQDEGLAKEQISELTQKIEQLQRKVDHDNQIIVQREQEKAQAAIAIKQLNEQLQNVLENNQCANEFMPANVSDWMRSGKN